MLKDLCKVLLITTVINLGGIYYYTHSDYMKHLPVSCTVTAKYIIPEGFNDSGTGRVSLKTDSGFVFTKNISKEETSNYVVGSKISEELPQFEIQPKGTKFWLHVVFAGLLGVCLAVEVLALISFGFALGEIRF